MVLLKADSLLHPNIGLHKKMEKEETKNWQNEKLKSYRYEN